MTDEIRPEYPSGYPDPSLDPIALSFHPRDAGDGAVAIPMPTADDLRALGASMIRVGTCESHELRDAIHAFWMTKMRTPGVGQLWMAETFRRTVPASRREFLARLAQHADLEPKPWSGYPFVDEDPAR